jgi:hypothetical protein
VYRCFVAKLGGLQQILASVVAVREVLYISSLLFATVKLPVFLLLDLRTVWVESAPLERLFRMALYIFTPHNYVILCAAARFPAWRSGFLVLGMIQVLADLSSCFALAALLASTVEGTTDATEAGPLKIGYSITAFGFLLFFGPLLVVTNLKVVSTQLSPFSATACSFYRFNRWQLWCDCRRLTGRNITRYASGKASLARCYCLRGVTSCWSLCC